MAWCAWRNDWRSKNGCKCHRGIFPTIRKLVRWNHRSQFYSSRMDIYIFNLFSIKGIRTNSIFSYPHCFYENFMISKKSSMKIEKFLDTNDYINQIKMINAFLFVHFCLRVEIAQNSSLFCHASLTYLKR